MYCKKCGSYIDNGMRFCKKCGAQVDMIELSESSRKKTVFKLDLTKILNYISKCKKKLAITAVVLVAMVCVLALQKDLSFLNLNKNITITYMGDNGCATADYEFSDEMRRKYPGIDRYINVIFSKQNNLSNGDIVTVSFDAQREKIKENYHVRLLADSFDVEIKDLNDPPVERVTEEQKPIIGELFIPSLDEECEASQNIFWTKQDLEEMYHKDYDKIHGIRFDEEFYLPEVGCANSTSQFDMYEWNNDYNFVFECILEVEFKDGVKWEEGKELSPSDLRVTMTNVNEIYNGTVVQSLPSYTLAESDYYINNPICDKEYPRIQLVVRDVYEYCQDYWPNMKIVFNWNYMEDDYKDLPVADSLFEYIGYYFSVTNDPEIFIIEDAEGNGIAQFITLGGNYSNESIKHIEIIPGEKASEMGGTMLDGLDYQCIVNEDGNVVAIF